MQHSEDLSILKTYILMTLRANELLRIESNTVCSVYMWSMNEEINLGALTADNIRHDRLSAE